MCMGKTVRQSVSIWQTSPQRQIYLILSAIFTKRYNADLQVHERIIFPIQRAHATIYPEPGRFMMHPFRLASWLTVDAHSSHLVCA